MVVTLAPSICQAKTVQDFHCLAVHVHDAGAALRRVAAHMGAGEPQVLAQELHQQGARVDVTGDGFAVHRHSDGGHGFPPKSWAKGLDFRAVSRNRRQIGSKSGRFCPGAWFGTSQL